MRCCSRSRIHGWGGIGGFLFSGIFVLAASLGGYAFLRLGTVFALAGAERAGGSLALVRRAEDRAALDTEGLSSRGRLL
jgi:hypothetical protein